LKFLELRVSDISIDLLKIVGLIDEFFVCIPNIKIKKVCIVQRIILKGNMIAKLLLKLKVFNVL